MRQYELSFRLPRYTGLPRVELRPTSIPAMKPSQRALMLGGLLFDAKPAE